MVCRAPCHRPAGTLRLSQGATALSPLHSRGKADPGLRGLSQLQGYSVPRCSHQHLAWRHCVPTPWGSLSTFSIQTPQPIQAEKGERKGLPITLLMGHMPPHHSPARLQAGERGAPRQPQALCQHKRGRPGKDTRGWGNASFHFQGDSVSWILPMLLRAYKMIGSF